MNLKKILKKIPFYLLLLILTIGASAIIGFLSFTGMYTLLPILSVALSSFFLSIAYEGEIYLQNIKSAISKLFKLDYLKREVAKDYLLDRFAKDLIDTKSKDCPQFFKDYEAQLQLLHKFSHKNLDEKSKKTKRKLEKTLKDMEHWFAKQLFPSEMEDETLTDYERELREWLKNNGQTEYKKIYEKRETNYSGVKYFSIISGVFMGIGITYLLVEAFAVLSFIPFGGLPFIIMPLAIIAGAAYTFLIYNAITDMIHHNTVVKWYNKIRDDFRQGLTVRNVFIAFAAVALFALTLALTVCTVGTWWTVVKNATPLFNWMTRIPTFVMGLINPIIMGVSQFIFNLQNTAESLELIDNATRSEKSFFKEIYKGMVKVYDEIMGKENWLQIINPFRLILKLTVTPLRLLFFVGHLISIGVTSDRVPGISEIASAMLGIISEGFEDMHYFIGDFFHAEHKHDTTKDLVQERLGASHGHNHSDDIPTRIIRLIFTFVIPLYPAAAAWEYVATRAVHKKTEPCRLIKLKEDEELSIDNLDLKDNNAVVLHQDNLYYANQRTEKIKKIKQNDENSFAYKTLKRKFIADNQKATDSDLDLVEALTGRHGRGKPVELKAAWNKHRGLAEEESVTIKTGAKKPSEAWQGEQTVHCVDNYIEKHLKKSYLKTDLAQLKIEGLQEFSKSIREMNGASSEDLMDRIGDEKVESIYSRHRFFEQQSKTETEEFLDNLSERVAPAA